MNYRNSADVSDSFPPISANSGLWLCASFEQLTTFEVKVRIWEALEFKTQPVKSIHFLGLLIKALLIGMGGDPSKPSDLVEVDPPVSLPIPNGMVHSTLVRTCGHDPSASAHALKVAWPLFLCDLEAITGRNGSVFDEADRANLRTITLEYGPAIRKPQESLHEGRPLALSVTLRPSTTWFSGG